MPPIESFPRAHVVGRADPHAKPSLALQASNSAGHRSSRDLQFLLSSQKIRETVSSLYTVKIGSVWLLCFTTDGTADTTGILDSSRRVHIRREPRSGLAIPRSTARRTGKSKLREGNVKVRGCAARRTGKTARALLPSPQQSRPALPPAPLPLPPSAFLGECERARGRACLAPR
jgi:hypothetical protein